MVSLECWDPGRQLVLKLSHSQTSWSGSFLTLCCFSEGPIGQSLSSQALDPWLWGDPRCSSHSEQVGEAAATQPQTFLGTPSALDSTAAALSSAQSLQGSSGRGLSSALWLRSRWGKVVMSEHGPQGNVYFPLTAFTPYTNQIFTTKELFSMHHHLPLNNMTQERGYIFKETFN